VVFSKRLDALARLAIVGAIRQDEQEASAARKATSKETR
jgi:hypothetical protein